MAQVIIVCFTIYELIVVGLSTMTFWALFILLQTLLIFYLVANNASKVHEEATKGEFSHKSFHSPVQLNLVTPIVH